MIFIDTHAHLYDEQFDVDREAMVQRSIDAGVIRIYLPNCDSTTIAPMLDVENAYPANCFAMMGLHPVYVKDNYEEELAVVKDWLDKRSFSAIGEIGLDKYWDLTHLEQQKIVFAQQIAWALEYGLPIVIHSRESTQDCIDMVKAKGREEVKGIFHCFSGTAEEAKAITDLGMYLGIGGVATFKKSTLPEIIKTVGIENLVLETDAPYLAPVPYRGKRNESSYIPLIAETISNALAMPLAEVARITSANAEKVFGKPIE